MLTAELLREHLHYNPETGVFIWLKAKANYIKPGTDAGRVNSGGYREIMVLCRRYKAHRLAWLYMTGNWPTDVIDHVNGEPGDNRWNNLREATRAQNMANIVGARPGRGVDFYRRSGKWRARIRSNGKCHFLGEFVTEAEAIDAYRSAAVRLHGEFSWCAAVGVAPEFPADPALVIPSFEPVGE